MTLNGGVSDRVLAVSLGSLDLVLEVPPHLRLAPWLEAAIGFSHFFPC